MLSLLKHLQSAGSSGIVVAVSIAVVALIFLACVVHLTRTVLRLLTETLRVALYAQDADSAKRAQHILKDLFRLLKDLLRLLR
jgi:hypothetical protein